MEDSEQLLIIRRERHKAAALLVIFIWCAYCCFFNIGASLSAADETLYAHVTQSVFSDGQWLRPLLDGHPYYAKIPFVNWCSAALIYVFGEWGWTHRLFSAVCGFGVFCLTYALARRMGISRSGAALAVLTLSGSWVFLFLNGIRRGCLDAPLNLFVLAAAYAAWRQREEIFGVTVWRILWICSFACALLSKSAGGLLVLPLTAIIVAVKPLRPIKFDLVGRFAFDTAIACALPVAYYVTAITKYPDLYTVGIQQEILTRISHSYNRSKGAFFYLSQLIEPWRFFPPLMILPIFAYSARRAIKAKEHYWSILCIWFAVVIIPFSFVRTRWPWYIDPAIPAGSMLFGAVWDDLRGLLGRCSDKWTGWILLMIRAFLLIMVLGVIGGIGHTAKSVWKSDRVRLLDQTITDLRAAYGEIDVVQFGDVYLESTEKVSIRMLSMHPPVFNTKEEVLTFLSQRQRIVLIGAQELMRGVAFKELSKSYIIIPPWRKRNRELAVALLEQAS